MFDKVNMRKLVLYLVATVFIAYGIGTFMLMSSTKGDFASIKTGKTASVDQEEFEPMGSVKEINLEVSSAKINIITENRKDLRARLTGSVTSSSLTTEPTLETSIDGSTLNVRVKTQNMYVGFTSVNLNLDVYVPLDYSENLTIKSSSGDINVPDIKLNDLNCNLSSGKLTLGKVSAKNFSYDSSSGSITAAELITKSSDLESSSGRIRLDKFEGDLKAKVSSGDIKIAYGEFNNNVNISVASGSVELVLPENSEFFLNARASSGNVSCQFPITISNKQKENILEGVVKNDKNKISINTSSGNIKIYK
jgi:lia operon protein LiaG